jgi:hypothetical protein
MNKNKLIIIILLVFNFISCKAQEVTSSKKEETKQLMSKIFNDFRIANQNINNKILTDISVSDINSWQQLIEKAHDIIPMALTYDAKTKEDKVDYTKIFTKDELDYMGNQVLELKSKTWAQYLGINLKKEFVTDDTNENIIQSKTYFLTVPVFTTNENHALVYQENMYGGSLVIYEKTEDKWKAVASAMVWVN